MGPLSILWVAIWVENSVYKFGKNMLRREWDSNPRRLFTSQVFKTCAIDHSATSPYFRAILYLIGLDMPTYIRYNCFMDFRHYHTSRRKFLHTYLNDFLYKEERLSDEEFSHVALERLASFSTRGKMLRGVFVMLGYEMFSGVVDQELNADTYGNDNVLHVAAAMELSQSALLIHDDIMDNDLTRRGEKTIYAQYKEDAEMHQIAQPNQYGKSMGMVVGDASLFLTYELIGNLEVEPAIRSRIMNRYSKEMLKVSLGQFLDFHYGRTHVERTRTEIMRMYHLKTGGYTFTLPFVLGAYLAGKTDTDLKALEVITANLGTIFQIKDDELGLFGNEAQTGKPVGSDISEDKKTLYRAALFESANEVEKEKLRKIYGSELSPENLAYIQKLMAQYGIEAELKQTVATSTQKALTHLDSLKCDSFYKTIFADLIEYNATRGS